MNKVKTTKVQGDADYALVPDRLKEFREDNPRADHKTQEKLHEDGSWVIRTTLIKDKSDENSASSQGSARYTEKKMQAEKSYEKLETISLGRALSNLGYLNDGQIASTEEMDEFHEWRTAQADEAIARINAANDLDELKEVFLSLGTVSTVRVIKAKDARKAELQNEDSKAGTK